MLVENPNLLGLWDKGQFIIHSKTVLPDSAFFAPAPKLQLQRVIEQDQMIPVNPADCVPGEELWPESSRLGSKHNNSYAPERDPCIHHTGQQMCLSFAPMRNSVKAVLCTGYLWTDSLQQKPIIASICKICRVVERPWAGQRSMEAGFLLTWIYEKPIPIQVTECSAIFKMSKLAELLDNQTWVSCCFNKALWQGSRFWPTCIQY